MDSIKNHLNDEELLYVVTQSIVLIRNLSYYRRGFLPDAETIQHNLHLIGDLSDALHNVDDVLGKPQNKVLTKLFIERLKQFLMNNPEYKSYFQRIML